MNDNEIVFDTYDDSGALDSYDDDDTDDSIPYIGDSKPLKVVSLRDIIEAIRANGIPQTFDDWFDRGKFDPTTQTYQIRGGCAIAQASINLGIDPTYIMFENPVREAISHNDSDTMSLADIADKLLETYGDRVDTITFTAREADYSQGLPDYIQTRLEDS